MKKKDLSEYMSKLGKKGGKNRALLLSPERRVEIAKMGSLAAINKRKLNSVVKYVDNKGQKKILTVSIKDN